MAASPLEAKRPRSGKDNAFAGTMLGPLVENLILIGPFLDQSIAIGAFALLDFLRRVDAVLAVFLLY